MDVEILRRYMGSRMDRFSSSRIPKDFDHVSLKDFHPRLEGCCPLPGPFRKTRIGCGIKYKPEFCSELEKLYVAVSGKHSLETGSAARILCGMIGKYLYSDPNQIDRSFILARDKLTEHSIAERQRIVVLCMATRGYLTSNNWKTAKVPECVISYFERNVISSSAST